VKWASREELISHGEISGQISFKKKVGEGRTPVPPGEEENPLICKEEREDLRYSFVLGKERSKKK